jgi:hypothetical protein
MILVEGDYFGDIIVSTPSLRDMRHVQSLSYLEVALLTRDSLEDTLKGFPDAERIVRTSAMKLALSRAMIVATAPTVKAAQRQRVPPTMRRQSRRCTGKGAGDRGSIGRIMFTRFLTHSQSRRVINMMGESPSKPDPAFVVAQGPDCVLDLMKRIRGTHQKELRHTVNSDGVTKIEMLATPEDTTLSRVALRNREAALGPLLSAVSSRCDAFLELHRVQLLPCRNPYKLHSALTSC